MLAEMDVRKKLSDLKEQIIEQLRYCENEQDYFGDSEKQMMKALHVILSPETYDSNKWFVTLRLLQDDKVFSKSLKAFDIEKQLEPS